MSNQQQKEACNIQNKEWLSGKAGALSPPAQSAKKKKLSRKTHEQHWVLYVHKNKPNNQANEKTVIMHTYV